MLVRAAPLQAWARIPPLTASGRPCSYRTCLTEAPLLQKRRTDLAAGSICWVTTVRRPAEVPRTRYRATTAKTPVSQGWGRPTLVREVADVEDLGEAVAGAVDPLAEEAPLTGPQRAQRALTFWSKVVPILGAYKAVEFQKLCAPGCHLDSRATSSDTPYDFRFAFSNRLRTAQRMTREKSSDPTSRQPQRQSADSGSGES